MNRLVFLRAPEVQRVLARAARAAGTALAVHYHGGRGEGPVVCGWGGCAACNFVSALPGGRGACHRSRAAASSAALRQGAPAPFICHLGFAGVCVAGFDGDGFVLTFGPYAPAEEPRALEAEVRAGLEELTGHRAETMNLSLDDVPRLPAATVFAVAEWAAETLRVLWASETPPENGEAEPELPAPRISYAPRARPAGQHRDPYQAAGIAAALAGGRLPQARDILRAQLAEADTSARPKAGVRRARIVAAVAAALEAAERARLDTDRARAACPRLFEEVGGARDERALLDAGMRVLGLVGGPKPPPGRPAPDAARPRTGYKELNAILMKRLADGVELREAAALLGEKPPAISKRLRRKFGMSYQEYLSRLRVDRAKELLRRTRLTAAEVARRVGIGDQSNFSKLFRKFEGLTPSEYRERFGKKR